jgi:steroid delta-isomerase-like uncharacterized protein
MPAPTDLFNAYLNALLARDWASVRSLIHADYTYTGSDGQEHKGPDAAIAQAEPFTTAFPDLRLEVKSIHEVGDVAAAEFVASGTHDGDLMGIAPTGKKMTMPVCDVIEVRDGKIYREREYYDTMHLMTQLGVSS